ncbi:hypothetical protein CL689_06315 [Candidatus Saccharibacteria bacterium]|nr:hypothetical protein [Candidatus Saccharibacteria bacterium]
MSNYICPKCPREVSYSDRFCSGCGTVLSRNYFETPASTCAAAPYSFNIGFEDLTFDSANEGAKRGHHALKGKGSEAPVGILLAAAVMIALAITSATQ